MKSAHPDLPPVHPRREFLKMAAVCGGTLAARQWLHGAETSRSDSAPMRAAIIGHTGRGNYGHELDMIFNHRPEIEVAAVADPDAAGRARAAKSSRAGRQYADYREMLEKERPQLVCIAPRWTDQHAEMGTAALEAGAHLFFEKPFTRTLAEADALLSAARSKGRKIAVAHQMRLAPSIRHLKRFIEGGGLGKLQQVHAHGKQDSRAGGEDMLVLGTHLFDLIRLFAGDPIWCTARVLQAGRDITRADARPATEKVGPVAGDTIDAQFACPGGVQVSFNSRAELHEVQGHWGMTLVGSEGVVRILADVSPTVYLLEAGKWEAHGKGKTDEWRRLEGDPTLTMSAEELGFGGANRRVVDDWLLAIREDREPECSGTAGMKAVEMVMAVYQAALSGGRVPFPLEERRHPLES